MKSKLAVAALILAAAFVWTWIGLAAADQPAKPSVRIGVYDSRGVAIAYARSAEFRRSMEKVRSDYEEAKSKKDERRMKELEKEASWMQVRLHQQGFSTAGVSSIMTKVADALAGVAREAGVVLIVSMWEMPYKDASIEVVDLTLPIARLFKPDEQTLKIIGELKNQQPIPFDELALDPSD